MSVIQGDEVIQWQLHLAPRWSELCLQPQRKGHLGYRLELPERSSDLHLVYHPPISSISDQSSTQDPKV